MFLMTPIISMMIIFQTMMIMIIIMIMIMIMTMIMKQSNRIKIRF